MQICMNEKDDPHDDCTHWLEWLIQERKNGN